ncbi:MULTISPECIES: histidine kinase [unclassified Sphingomonas]|uniref:histidine kinase n=1 Tax=unclassified Sphingomonas TaxID=196159 RepID=UPI0020166AD4|nr:MULTISPECIES: histidine kinase [unclassified Sphingomonas]
MRIILNRRRRRALRSLAGDRSGTSLIEFALGLPLLLLAGLWGIELTHFAIMNQRVSQLTLELADNASRVGLFSGQTTIQLREADINDVLQQTRLHGSAIDLTTKGRVTLSSLENVKQSYDTAATQRIHWQRCIGTLSGTSYDSSYGTTSVTAGTTATQADAGTAAPNGMGDAGSQVSAPPNSGVMFVEVNYLYTPLVGAGWFTSQQRLHYIASFIVRDNRDFSKLYNPAPAATKATCDLHSS